LIESNNLSRTSFEQLYKRESDAAVKERMLFVLNVVYDKHIPAQVASDLHRSRTWASDWLKRYREEGIEGLKTRSKSGRPTEIPQEIVYKIQNKLASSKQGWRTTKQVNDIIIQESVIQYHKIYIYTLLRKWGFKQKVPRRVHVNTASKEEKERFKKEQERYWII
jgi:transposase